MLTHIQQKSDTELAVRPDDEDISAYPYKYVMLLAV